MLSHFAQQIYRASPMDSEKKPMQWRLILNENDHSRFLQVDDFNCHLLLQLLVKPAWPQCTQLVKLSEGTLKTSKRKMCKISHQTFYKTSQTTRAPQVAE